MFKKLLITFILSFAFLPLQNVNAQTETKNESKTIHLFSSPTCPHCTSAKIFLENLQNNEGLKFIIEEHTISRNVELAKNFYEKYNVPSSKQGLVPAIFLDEKYFIGFSKQTEEEIISYLKNEDDKENETKNQTIKIPIIGEINLLNFSLPLLALILGITDGFNVCSLGALMLILGLVMVLGSRKRIFILGGIFLLTTAIVYGLLIFLWHQFFSFVAPFIRSMEMLIGLLALGGGIYLLREFYKAYKSGPVCSSNNLMTRLSPKIEKIFKNNTNWLVLMGTVALFATIVTIIEFPCSAFLPVIFTSILVDSGTPLTLSLFYIGIYMSMYLLDELIIFLIAVWTLRIKIVSPKFIIFFNLLAALIFIFLGVYYLSGLIG